MTDLAIDPAVPPSGAGCVECETDAGWWFHLRRCAACGHIGCCDDSLARHARGHFESTGHAIIRSFEPGETWFWDYAADAAVDGPPLAPPEAHPDDQTAPGPAERLPADWRDLLRARR